MDGVVEMILSLYHYNAIVVSIYDGDTITADIDLGLSTWIKGAKLRLARINTPEIRGEERPEGLISRDYLRDLIGGRAVRIETIKDRKGKYGRYLAEVWLEQGSQWLNVNDQLVSAGYAEYKEY